MLCCSVSALLVDDSIELLSHLWVKLFQRLVLFCSRVLLAKHVIHPTQTKMRVRRFRIKTSGLFVFRRRVAVKVQAVVSHAKLVMRLRVIRFQVDGFLVSLYGISESSRAVMLLSLIEKVCGSSRRAS